MAKPRRSGFTVIEVIIALAVFSVLMIALMQSLTGVVGFVSQEEALGDIELSGRKAVSQITNDIANAAWFYSYSSTTHQFDTSVAPLYPSITVDSASPTGAEKDALEFIKIRTSSTVAPSPYSEHYDVIKYNPSTAPALVTFDQYNASASFAAAATPFLILNPNFPQAPSSNDVYISHVWEYYVGATGGNNFDQNQDPTRVRHYRYSVINVDSSTNTGQLVRTYYNANGSVPAEVNGSWNPTDRVVLLENVKSFVVSNHYTTGTSLNDNQIRFTITVAKPESGHADVTVTRTFNFIAAMRSITH